MSAINSSIIPAVATETLLGYAVDKLLITLANTEYTYTFPAGTKAFSIQNRDSGVIKLKSSAAGEYWTFYPGQPYFPVNIKGTASISIILESPNASQHVEIIYWN